MHFLKKDEACDARYSEQYACVVVLARGHSEELVIESGSLAFVKDGVLFVELPSRFRVLTEGGEEIKRPRGRVRVISVSTLDPCHMLADVVEEHWKSWRRH